MIAAAASAARSAVDGLYQRPALLLVLTTLFWAGNAIAGQLAKGEITPLQLVLARWIGVTLLLWPLFGGQVAAHWAPIRPRLPRIALMAAAGFTGFNTLFYFASLETSAVNIGILQGAVPVFVMLGAFLAHGARVTRLQAVGVAVTLAGVVLVAARGAPLALLETEVNRGDLLMLVACVLYSGYAVMLVGRPAVPGVVFFTLMAPIAALAALPAAVAEAIALGEAYRWPTAEGGLIVAYVALFPSCLAQLFFLRGVDLIGPGRAGVYTNLVPVFAAALAVGLLGQEFAVYHAVALVAVIGGIALAQHTPRASAG
jgi:drug/metabolite transporter (DMT)-like permease